MYSYESTEKKVSESRILPARGQDHSPSLKKLVNLCDFVDASDRR